MTWNIVYGGRENEDPFCTFVPPKYYIPSEVKLVRRYKVKKLWLQEKELAFTCHSFQVKLTLDKHLILGHTIYKQWNSSIAKRGFSMNNIAFIHLTLVGLCLYFPSFLTSFFSSHIHTLFPSNTAELTCILTFSPLPCNISLSMAPFPILSSNNSCCTL